ncbi:MAG: hypothetical protein ACJ789_11065 [Thermomicrobiales bacterium]
MRVQVRRSPDVGALEVVIRHPLPRVPEWISIRPDGEGRRFLTLPAGHVFASTSGEDGVSKRLRFIARAVLDGDMSQAEAEAEFADVLTEWSEISSPSACAFPSDTQRDAHME